MSLYLLIGRFLRRHWAAYASSGLMLAGIALLIVWIPRQIGHVVDGLAAGSLRGRPLLVELGWLLLAGVIVYFLRVGWRLKLYAAAYLQGV
jgi:ATP-binding cassette subfamily B multidrug efflux pump